MSKEQYVTKITFNEVARPLVETGAMRAVIVRDRTPYDIDPMLTLKAGRVEFGQGLVTDMMPVKVFGNGYARLGAGLPLMTLDRLRAKLMKDLGLDKEGFKKMLHPMPFDGVVVWFDFQPLPEPA